MGPIIGMSPDKKAETPGAQEERAGLRGACGAGTLPEAESASSPLATSLDRAGGADGAAEDEELTNLNWLHENLLQNFTLGGPEAHPSGSPLFDIEGDGLPFSSVSSSASPSSSSLLGGRGGEKDSLKSKPPFSFSLLIYMAIEQSPGKSLPVKDIYGWILEHFPYFSSAPTGWKNSVRHNLSLNKCFRKVERNLGKANGKGSLWCVDPEYRPNLIQALKKQHFPTAHAFCTPPASPPSASSPPRHLVLQDQSCSLKESDIDAATAMMLLNSAPGQHADRCGPDSPMDLSRPDAVLVSSDPKQDHNYSSVPVQRCSSRSSSSSSSSLSSLDEGGGAPPQARRAGSEGFHSDEDSDLGEERGALGGPGHAKPAPHRPTLAKGPPGKKARCETRPEVDEELKEAAGSLLHLAGIRTCLDVSKNSAKSKKLGRK
ncbi:forkhead box protein N2-like isoform X1 [Scleropages formosus]|uniref:Forkhead box N2 n=1 Tax=Scleropages formosus TaxID=113540 RepID=A0A8C9R039_SCLFO|nr:forkhead box protein N2 isoform X1 [Scleropages formosus]XP_029110289.1 forkhead box protein N2 isoform X1 [Scleropages formosus]XP_029110290.1 forkhead box protein N2 isoform X1 [Scleropages formosus]XP_029110292.1 forkhead box protein N2 isoform X1 [Scleropages formosus]